MDCHLIENDFLRSEISSYGAELQSIFVPRHDTEYLWQGDPRYWARRAPVLFPIVGRVRGGSYLYREKVYSIESPHGFAQRTTFRVKRHDSDSIRFVSEASPETLLQYPFLFRFAVEYALDGPSLRILFDIENRDEKAMPFSLGFHPAFRVPLRDKPFESHCLAFGKNEHPERWTLDDVFLSGQRIPFRLEQDRFLPLSRSLFDDEAIILDGMRKRSVSLLDADRRPRWTIQFDDFRFLAIWQPAGTKPPFLCLETWDGLPDLVGDEPGPLVRKPAMRSLRPGESYTASFRIAFE